MIGIDVLVSEVSDMRLELEYISPGCRSLGGTPVIETIDTLGYIWQRMCRRYEF